MKKCSWTLGNSAVRLSEFVRKSAREPSREPSRAIFGQLDNSARLGSRSDKPKILDLGSAVGRTEEEILSECPPLIDNLGANAAITSVSFSKNGRHILGSSNDQAARVWDLSSGKITQSLTGHQVSLEINLQFSLASFIC